MGSPGGLVYNTSTDRIEFSNGTPTVTTFFNANDLALPGLIPVLAPAVSGAALIGYNDTSPLLGASTVQDALDILSVAAFGGGSGVTTISADEGLTGGGAGPGVSLAVSVSDNGALGFDAGASPEGSLTVRVDGATITINGSNQLEVGTIPIAQVSPNTFTVSADAGLLGGGSATVGGTVSLAVDLDGAGGLQVSSGTSPESRLGVKLDGTTLVLSASGIALNLGEANTWTADQTLGTGIQLVFTEDGGADTISIVAPSSMSASYTLTLPVDDGALNQVLTTDGGGTLSWTTPAGGGGSVDNLTDILDVFGSPSTGDVVVYDATSPTGWHMTSFGAEFTVTAGGSIVLATGGVANSKLTNAAVTVAAGSGLSGGGAVALGSSVSLDVDVDANGGLELRADTSPEGRLAIKLDGATLSLGAAGLSLTNSSLTVATDAGLSGGGAVALGGTVNLSVDVAGSGGLQFNAGASPEGSLGIKLDGATLSLAAAGLSLTNDSLTISTDDGLSGGGAVSLGGTVNLALDIDAAGGLELKAGASPESRLGVKLDGATLSLSASGVALNLGNANTWTADQTLGAGIQLVFTEDGGSDTISIIAPGSMSGSYTLTLPVDDGALNQVLTTNGGGVLSWSTPSGGGGSVDNLTDVLDVFGSPSTGDVIIYDATSPTGWHMTSFGAEFTVTAGGSIVLATSGIANSKLANSAVTVAAGAGLSGGGSVALGSSVNLDVDVDANGGLELRADTSPEGRLAVKLDGATLSLGAAGLSLTDSSVTVTADGGLSGGGEVSLGGTVNLAVDIDAAGGLEFKAGTSPEGRLGVKLDGATLTLSASGIALNLANANTWTATQAFDAAGDAFTWGSSSATDDGAMDIVLTADAVGLAIHASGVQLADLLQVYDTGSNLVASITDLGATTYEIQTDGIVLTVTGFLSGQTTDVFRVRKDSSIGTVFSVGADGDVYINLSSNDDTGITIDQGSTPAAGQDFIDMRTSGGSTLAKFDNAGKLTCVDVDYGFGDPNSHYSGASDTSSLDSNIEELGYVLAEQTDYWTSWPLSAIEWLVDTATLQYAGGDVGVIRGLGTGTTNIGYHRGQIPFWYDGGDITIEVTWTVSTGTGVARAWTFQVGWRELTTSASWEARPSMAQSSTDITVSTSAANTSEITTTFTITAPSPALSPGRWLDIAFQRLGDDAADTFAGQVRVIAYRVSSGVLNT